MRRVKSIIYAHGLGGSPQSAKARLIEEHFHKRGVAVNAPALAVPSLERLSPLAARGLLSEAIGARSGGSTVVIASSFGAFLALHALALREQSGARVEIEALVLLAPVVDPWHHGSMLLSEQVEQQWRAQGSLPIVDLERQCTVPVHYQFVEELQALGACRAPLKVPTLIVHGRSDPVVSVEQSRLFAVSQSRVTLVTVEGDHSLLENPNDLVGLIEDFIGRVELLQNE